MLVAEHEGEVVGYIALWTRYRSTEPDDDPREHGFIPDLVVSADHRGQGIGRSLLRSAEERMRDAGASSLQLSVKAGNEVARALYAAEGFVEAEVYLEKSLAAPAQAGKDVP